MSKNKSVETKYHGIVNYHLYGDKGECNEYYIIIAHKDVDISKLLDFLSDYDVMIMKEVLDLEYNTFNTDYILYYIRFNFNENIVWKEPLYQRFDLSCLKSNIVIIESNNACCPRDDYNETDKPWRYFSVYGRFASDNAIHLSFVKEGYYCDVNWEVFVNAVCHASKDTDFECESAFNDVKKWIRTAGNLDDDIAGAAIYTISNIMMSERYDESGNIKTEYDALMTI